MNQHFRPSVCLHLKYISWCQTVRTVHIIDGLSPRPQLIYVKQGKKERRLERTFSMRNETKEANCRERLMDIDIRVGVYNIQIHIYIYTVHKAMV